MSTAKTTATKKPRKGALTRQNFFKLKVNTKTKNGCWNWLGAVNATSSTPLVSWEGKLQPARPIAYAIKTGLELQPGESIKPTCGNPRCVNPAHGEVVWRGNKEVPANVLKMGQTIAQITKLSRDIGINALSKVADLKRREQYSISVGKFKPTEAKGKELISYLERKAAEFNSLMAILRETDSE